MSKENEKQQSHKKGSLRHAEKRRIATCLFADRIARASVQAFVERVPEQWRHENKQVCLATIVAHFNRSPNSNCNGEHQPLSSSSDDCGYLQVMALGVGTKYLSEDTIRSERTCGANYGMRMRDLHAEVLARRAFRRTLLLEMKTLLQEREGNTTNKTSENTRTHTAPKYRPILQLGKNGENGPAGGKFSLVDGVTIHMYTSSTPCGNSSLKKFAKMAKEKYDSTLGPDQWPEVPHSENPIPAHSLHLGNFSLLVKKDYSSERDQNEQIDLFHIPKKQRTWPANINDDWCPPGTSLPHLGRGSIHTCSDKICRWNCIGLQGSLLASLLDTPLYMASLTVGRKFTRCIAQRAVCCRAVDTGSKKRVKRKRKEGMNEQEEHEIEDEGCRSSGYKLNHPSIMGTGVYLDDSGVIAMSGEKTVGQDVRFLSTLCWIWCPDNDEDRRFNAECLDGDTGFLYVCKDANIIHGTKETYSSASTYALTELFLDSFRRFTEEDKFEKVVPQTLDQLRELKCRISPKYEASKDFLLLNHKVFYQWNRRQGRKTNP